MAHIPAFVAAVGERFKTLSPDIEYDTRTNGASFMMRIAHDTRFSKDKPHIKPSHKMASGQ